MSVHRRGEKWSYAIDLGVQSARPCLAGCREGGGHGGKGRAVLVWGDDRRNTCPKCEGPLAAPIKKRRQAFRGGFDTKRAALKAEREKKALMDKGVDPFPESLAFGEFALKWLDERRKIRKSTRIGYQRLLRRHIIPAIGNLDLARIRPAHIADTLNRMSATGLSPATVTQARAVMSAAFKQALKWDLIPVSPVPAVERPHIPRPDREVPTAGQLRTVVEDAQGDRFEIPTYLVVGTGARRGEVLGCRWSDLDLATGRLRIERSLQRLPGADGLAFEIVQPKSARSRRQVTLPPFVIERLKRHKVEQAERRLKLGAGWDDSFGDLICEDGTGRPMVPDSFSHAWKRLCKRAGLSEKVRLHDGRHAFATIMLEEDVPLVVVSAALGHSTIAVTGDIYSHVRERMADTAGAAVQRAWEAAR